MSPELFWGETPRSFVTIMEGAARRAKREFDLAVIGAWHGEAFARTKRLDRLSGYLGDRPAPRQAQTPDEMLAALRLMKAGGAPLNIRQIN